MKIRKISLFLLVFLFTAQLVVAVGVTSPYWDTKPLGLNPGESVEVQLLLQNMMGDKDVTLMASIAEGADIATLLGESQTYAVPFGVKDVPVLVKVSIPEGTSVGGVRTVKVSFTQSVADDTQGKMVQMTTGVGAIIPVEITPKFAPEESSSSTILVAGGAGLLLVGGIASYMIIRKRRSEVS